MKLINRAPPPLRSYIFSFLHFLKIFKEDMKIPEEGEGEGKGEGGGGGGRKEGTTPILLQEERL